MLPLKDGFPVFAALYAAVASMLLFLIYWPAGIIFLFIIILGYAAARKRWGRTRVHDVLNRATEEPAPWC